MWWELRPNGAIACANRLGSPTAIRMALGSRDSMSTEANYSNYFHRHSWPVASAALVLDDFSDGLADVRLLHPCCHVTKSKWMIFVRRLFCLKHPKMANKKNYMFVEKYKPMNKTKKEFYICWFGEFFKWFFDIFRWYGANWVKNSLSMSNFVDLEHCLKFNFPYSANALHISVQMFSANDKMRLEFLIGKRGVRTITTTTITIIKTISIALNCTH